MPTLPLPPPAPPPRAPAFRNRPDSKPGSPQQRQSNLRRRSSDALERFFATCPRGLETALVEELVRLGARNAHATDGGAAFEGTFALACLVNLWSRLASRVLWQVGLARYRDQQDVYDAALKIDWPCWFDVRCTIRVNVTAIRSPLARPR